MYYEDGWPMPNLKALQQAVEDKVELIFVFTEQAGSIRSSRLPPAASLSVSGIDARYGWHWSAYVYLNEEGNLEVS